VDPAVVVDPAPPAPPVVTPPVVVTPDTVVGLPVVVPPVVLVVIFGFVVESSPEHAAIVKRRMLDPRIMMRSVFIVRAFRLDPPSSAHRAAIAFSSLDSIACASRRWLLLRRQ